MHVPFFGPPSWLSPFSTGFPFPRAFRPFAYVHSARAQTLATRIGHNDNAQISVNGRLVANLQGGDGFRAAAVNLPLDPGWNQLTVTLENGENVNWRWCGLSLAIKEGANVRFALKPE